MFKTYSAIPTPFLENQEIDFPSLSNLLDYQIQSNIDGIVACGSTGEKMSMNFSEYSQVAQFTIDKIKDRVFAVLGCSDSSLERVIRNTILAKELKYEAVLITNPFYVKAQEKGIVEYFVQISKHSDIPIIIYNVPSRTGQNMTNELIIELSKIKNIIGLKESTDNTSRLQELKALNLRNDFEIFSGEDALTLKFNQNGAKGVISVVSNTYPELVKNIQNHFKDEEYDKFLQIANLMFVETNPVPVKYFLYKMNIIKSPKVRLPLSQLTQENVTKINNILIK